MRNRLKRSDVDMKEYGTGYPLPTPILGCGGVVCWSESDIRGARGTSILVTKSRFGSHKNEKKFSGHELDLSFGKQRHPLDV